MNEFARYMNALSILILSGVLIGAFVIEYGYHENPCPLCFLQRLFMIGVASGELLNLKFGIRMRHYAISFFSAVLGAGVSIRQITVHICPGEPSFGSPIFGLSLYTWAFLVFVCSILGMSLLLFFYSPKENATPRKMGWFPVFAFGLIFLITLANIYASFSLCGFGPCTE